MKKFSGLLGIQREVLKDRRIIAVFFISFMMTMGSDLINPLLPGVINSFGIDEGRAGLIISLFSLPTIFLTPVIGRLADKYGRKVFLASGMLLFGISGVLTVFFTESFNLLLLFRILQGVGFATAMPLTITLIGDAYQGNLEVAAQGLRTFFIAMGNFIFPVLGGALAVLGWYYPFILYILAVPFACYLWFSVPEAKLEIGNNHNNILNSMLKLKESRLIMVLMASIIRFFLSYGFRAFLPLLLVRRFDSSLALGGVMLGVTAITKSVISLQAGTISCRLGLLYPLIIGFLIYSLSCFFLPVVPFQWMILFIALVFGVGEGMLAPFQKSMITQNVSAEERASIVALNSSLQAVGRTLSPVIIGFIIVKSGLIWAFWTLGLTAFIPFSYFLINKKNYRQKGTDGRQILTSK